MSNLPFHAVIFDLDGTLVQSRLDFPAIRKAIACPEDQDILRYLEHLPEGEQVRAKQTIESYELEDARDCHALPGVDTLLERLRSAGIRTGIVTRNSPEATQIKLERNRIKVEQVLTRDCAAPKPKPDALLQLANAWQLPTRHCIYVGDYRYDLEAARAADMWACLYCEPGQKLSDWSQLADAICQDYDAFESLMSQVLNRA